MAKQPATTKETSGAGTGFARAAVAALVLFLGLSLAAAARADELFDPLVWKKPAKPPALREVLKGKEYDDAFAKILKAYDLESRRKMTGPIAWLQVETLEPQGNAIALGLKVGDRLLSLNGKPLWHSLAPKPFKANGPQVLEVEGADGKARTIRFDDENEMFGAHLLHIWEIDLWYLRSKRCDPKWDKEVMVGWLAHKVHPALSETAWFHAVQKGYKPDEFTWSCAMWAAAGQARHHVAFDFGAFLPEDASRAKEQTFFEFGRYEQRRWSVGGYRLDLYKELVQEGDQRLAQAFAKRAQELIDLHQSRPEDVRKRPSPTERASKLKRVDILDKVEMQDEEFPEFEAYLRHARSGKAWELSGATDEMARLRCGMKEPLKQMELVVKFTIKPTDEKKNRYTKSLKVGLVERGSRGDAPASLTLESRRNIPTIVAVGLGTTLNYPRDGAADPEIRLDGKTEHEVRIIRVDDQIELYLNNRRIIYVPADERIDKADVILWAIGMTVDIRELKIYELAEKK